MEVLVLLLAEFMVVPILLFMFLFLESGASLLSVTMPNIIAFLLDKRCSGVPHRTPDDRRKCGDDAMHYRQDAPSQTPSTAHEDPWRWPARLRLLRLVMLILLGLTVVGLLCVNTWFFEPALRWILDGVQARTGIEITFESANGNLFSGRANVAGLRLERSADALSEFSLGVEDSVVDVKVWSLLWGPATIEELKLTGMRGSFTRVASPDRVKVKRAFRVSRCVLEDMDVNVEDRTRSGKPLVLSIRINDFDSRPLRSQWAVFDVLFHTNARGTIDGNPFLVESRESEEGMETRWVGEALPIKAAAAYVGGPLDWIDGGELHVDIANRWKYAEEMELEMHYTLIFKDISAGVPKHLGLHAKAVAQPIVAFMNKHERELPLAFDMLLDLKRFDGACSVDATGFWEACTRGVTREFAVLTSGVDAGKVKDIAGKELDRLKDYLNRRRQDK